MVTSFSTLQVSDRQFYTWYLCLERNHRSNILASAMSGQTNRGSQPPQAASPQVSSLTQVGFGLKGDLWAIAEALPDGTNCVAVVNSVLEMKLLQQHLLRSGSISQASLPSFAHLEF